MKREIYVIGDVHGEYDIIEARFGDIRCSFNHEKKDVLFVAGDAGFVNSYETSESKQKRIDNLNTLPFIIIVVLGNHENYDIIESFEETTIFEGNCYKEPGVDVYYAKNGQIFNIDGTKIFTFNGGLSIDKEKRLEYEKQYGVKFWWEQEIKEQDFDSSFMSFVTNRIDYVITHDVPLEIFKKLTPFIPGRFKDQICPLQTFFQKLYIMKKHTHWYAGHYHPSYPVKIDNFTVLPIGHVEKIL